MTLIQKLRQLAPWWPVCAEAADEIERLNAPINEAYITDTETRLRRELELRSKRDEQFFNEFQELRAEVENERLKEQINLTVLNANQIEMKRLRTENEALCLQREGLLSRVAELRAENEKYRARMKRINELNLENLADIDTLLAKRPVTQSIKDFLNNLTNLKS